MKNLFLLIITCITLTVNAQSNLDAFSKSYTFEANKEYAKAIQVLEPLVSETSYSVQLRLGWLNYLRADYLQSKSHYQKAINIKNNSMEAKLGLIYPLQALSSWDEVIKVYHKILTIDPNHSSTHYQLAYIYFVRKKYSQAESHLKSVLKLYPFDYSSNALLGSVYVKLGKIKEAKEYYTLALEYDPRSTEIKKIIEGL